MNGLNREYKDVKRIKGVRWLLLWVMLTQFVLRAALSAIVSFMPEPPDSFERYFNYIQLGIITVLTFLIPIIIYGLTAWRKTERTDADEMRFNKFSGKLTWMIVIMAVSGQFVMAILNLPFAQFGGTGSEKLIPHNMGEFVAALIVTAMLPGIFEEFWMRGIVLSVYERRSTFAAIFFTTVMFALLHGSISKLPGVLLLGFVAAIITIRANSVYAAMLYHILSNTTSLIYSYVAASYNIGDMFTWAFFAVMGLIFIVSFICFLVISPKKKRHRCKNEGALLVKNFLSLPVILCMIIGCLKIYCTK